MVRQQAIKLEGETMKNTSARYSLRLAIAAASMIFTLIGCSGGSGGGTTGDTTGGTIGTTTTVPAAPVGLSAVPGSSKATLGWNPASGATSYNLYWSTASGVTTANGTKIAGINSPYVHSGLSNGTPYYYIVTATNSLGESSPSAQVSATPNATAAAMYTIGGYLVGLAAGQSVVLQNNSGDNLTISGNGEFTFALPAANYSATILTQPANGQICAIAKNNTTSGSSGTGTATGPVNTIRLSCASIFTFAGSGKAGVGNALGEDAVFNHPSGMTMDAAGNLYVADAGEYVIRKITPAGVATTLAGSGAAGYADGTGAAAQFNFLQFNIDFAGVAVDSSGNVYVADNGNNVIRKVSPAGVVTTLAGQTLAGYANGTGSAAQFNSPHGVAVDSLGNVYVADTGNNVIRQITPAGVVTTFAGSLTAGKADGTGFAAQFCGPQGLAIDSSNNIYVADSCYSSIRKVTPAAAVTTLAGGVSSGYFDATGSAALFNQPEGVAVDGLGNVYVTDFKNTKVRMVTPTGIVSTLVGGAFTTAAIGLADGPVTLGAFYWPQGIAVDSSGNIYLADTSGNKIRKISATPYSYTVNGHVMGLTSGASMSLQNNLGDTLTITANGFFTFTAPLNTTQTYSVTVSTQPSGQICTVTNGTGAWANGDVLAVNVNCATVSTYAGTGTAGLANAASPLAAAFNRPGKLGFDNSGSLYVIDVWNQSVRKITAAGVVSTLAGSGVAGYADGPGTGAKFNFDDASGLAADAAGNIYVSDTNNRLIRMITSTGVVSTLAGNTGFCCYKDGIGSAAWFYLPGGIALDGLGNLYVAEYGNNSIRKIVLSTAEVTTFAGGGGNTNSGYVNGIGTAARFTRPSDIAVDATGTLYVADSGNGAVRKITPGGVVSTLAGHSGGGWMYSGHIDSTGTGALFGGPASIAVDAAQNVYVTDGTVRVINPLGTVTTLAGSPNTLGYLDGNGASALFDFCGSSISGGIAVDGSGNLYVGDSCNNVIRKIVP